jgi:hypothetical protein
MHTASMGKHGVRLANCHRGRISEPELPRSSLARAFYFRGRGRLESAYHGSGEGVDLHRRRLAGWRVGAQWSWTALFGVPSIQCGLDLPRLWPTCWIVGIAPIEYGPILLLRPSRSVTGRCHLAIPGAIISVCLGGYIGKRIVMAARSPSRFIAAKDLG